MKRPLVVFGTTDVAELAHYYFSRDSSYEVEAFTVDGEYLTDGHFCGCPVLAFEELAESYPPDKYELFVALGYSRLNQLRRDKFDATKSAGYRLATYISSRASILNDGRIGTNCFILEDNTIQPFASIGDNVTLWSGNHIGHHSVIEDHCFITSHVVISGRVQVRKQCFIGVNATLRDHITVGERCVVGAGAVVLGDVDADGVYVGAATERSRVPSQRLRNI